MSVDSITVYLTVSNAIRKTADDCRRILALYDALRVKYEKVTIDTKEMMGMIAELSGSKALPQTFVGDQFLGNYEAIFKLNEKQSLAAELRRLGYAGEVVGGENIPVATVDPQTIKKRVVVKKKVAKKREPGAPEDDDEPPPPPPDDDEDEMPPPPPDDEMPPPPPDSAPPSEAGSEPPPPPDDDDE